MKLIKVKYRSFYLFSCGSSFLSNGKVEPLHIANGKIPSGYFTQEQVRIGNPISIATRKNMRSLEDSTVSEENLHASQSVSEKKLLESIRRPYKKIPKAPQPDCSTCW
jgi:hypothetical protein